MAFGASLSQGKVKGVRRQLPAYSPLSLSTLRKAAFRAVMGGDGARRSLETLLKDALSAREVVLTGSGTQALTLALLACASQSSEECIVGIPAYSCFDLATAVKGAGIGFRFYDLDPTTLSPDAESLSRVFSEGITALVAGNLYGYPLDWTVLGQRCREAGILLIEDAAQGLGSTWAGVNGGAFGDLTVVSFGRGKGWTGGGGGALLSRDQSLSLADIKRAVSLPVSGTSLRSAITSLCQFVLGRPALFGIPSALPFLGLGETHYKEPRTPLGIPAFSAALALETSEASAREMEMRTVNANRLMAVLTPGNTSPSLEFVQPLEGGESSFLRLPAVLPAGFEEKGFREALGRVGIMRGYPLPLPDLPALSDGREDAENSFRGARTLSKRLITFPTHSFVSERDLSLITDLFSAKP